MVYWLRPWCASMGFWVQLLVDVCINIPCTNVVHKHVRHGESCENLFVDKIIEKN